MDKQQEISFQLGRRDQLLKHIEFLYVSQRPVKDQILQAEGEIEMLDKRLEFLGYVRN
jgi:hypothetical protein